jgi:hypothetical protein
LLYYDIARQLAGGRIPVTSPKALMSMESVAVAV